MKIERKKDKKNNSMKNKKIWKICLVFSLEDVEVTRFKFKSHEILQSKKYRVGKTESNPYSLKVIRTGFLIYNFLQMPKM